MTEFNQEYYDTLTEDQKRDYVEDCNLKFTMDKCYAVSSVSKEEAEWENLTPIGQEILESQTNGNNVKSL